MIRSWWENEFEVILGKEKRKVQRGIEPRLKDLKSSVLTVTPLNLLNCLNLLVALVVEAAHEFIQYEASR